MRWLPYFILGYIALGAQVGLKAHVMIGSAWPNLVLLLVIFISIHAPRDAALLAAFGLGVCQDLLTQQPIGIFALSYGLVAMFTVSTQQLVYRGHPLTHFSLALAGAFVTMMIILLQGWIRGPRMWGMSLPLFYSAIYTAVLSPIVLAMLNRTRRVFAFQTSRKRMRF